MYRLNLGNRPVEKSAGLFLPIGGAAMCSFRSLAAAQRFTPVSHFNLFYRNIRRKSAPDTAYSLCFLPVLVGKKAKFLEMPPVKCYAILI